MDDAENDSENSLQSLQMTSLSGGKEILPGMRSEKLYFKPINYPQKWDLYKGLSQMYIVDDYLLEMANIGTDDPGKLFRLMKGLSNAIDWDIFCCETNQINKGASYTIIEFMTYIRALELGVWDARFITLSLITDYKSILEPLADLLLYNESPVPVQMLPVAALYIDLLCYINTSEEKDSLKFSYNIREICEKHPQMISSMVKEIKNEPFPTTKYVSWALEKAYNNIEAQKKWPFFSE